jgi:hypothetical protein
MPARKFSATYAPEFIPKVIIAVISSGNPLIAKIANAIKKSCNAIGVPLMTPIYKSHIKDGMRQFLFFLPIIFIVATTVPSVIPISTAKNVSIKVSFNPENTASKYFFVEKTSIIPSKKFIFYPFFDRGNFFKKIATVIFIILVIERRSVS